MCERGLMSVSKWTWLSEEGAAGVFALAVERGPRKVDGNGVMVKIKTIRPFPFEEVKEATANAKHIFVPEFNIAGWLGREIKAIVPNNERVICGPHVAGGMTMPSEVMVDEIKKHLGMKTRTFETHS